MFRFAAAFAVILGTVMIQPAAAQQPACTKRGDVVDHLGKKYSEAPVAMGLANNGDVIEVLSSKTGESWTIIITMPNGTACMHDRGGRKLKSNPQDRELRPDRLSNVSPISYPTPAIPQRRPV